MAKFKKYLGIVSIIALAWTLFQLYTAWTGPLVAHLQRAIHLGLALALTFSIFYHKEKSKTIMKKIYYFTAIFLSLASIVYMVIEFERIVSRISFVSELKPLDFFFAVVLVILVFETSRRVAGAAMTILAGIFVLYGFLGPFLPGIFNHKGLSWNDVVEVMYFSSQGLLGAPLAVSVNYVFYFVLFAVFLERSGAGKLIIDIAFRLTGRSRGGPAKAAVIASSGMGTISGSAVANVASTGVLTIPLMKKVGFSPRFAASVEALSSTGGQLLPPIMGAAAFLMANSLGVPYMEVVVAAIIPSVLLYIGLLLMVHFQTGKLGIKSVMDKSKLESYKSIFSRCYLLVPLVILVYFIFTGTSLQRAALYSIILLIIISSFRKSSRLGFFGLLDAMIDGAKQAIQVAIPCAIAGIIVGIVLHSGLGLKFTSIILQFSFGSMMLTVILVSLSCIVLSMGMPTSSAYIMASVLLAPALTNFGFLPMAAHMFILYFAAFSMITPPVALASYSASSIAGANANETGFYAFYLSIPLFVIAFSLLLNPALLLEGSVYEIIKVTSLTIISVAILTVAIIGYFLNKVNYVYRIIALIGSLLIIYPSPVTDITGLVIVVLLVIYHLGEHFSRNRKGTVNTFSEVNK